jgi:hypothetical protein
MIGKKHYNESLPTIYPNTRKFALGFFALLSFSLCCEAQNIYFGSGSDAREPQIRIAALAP